MTRRKRLSKPSAKMIDVALRTAAELTADESAPPHVRARAASILLAREPDDEADVNGADESPGVCILLPRNGRESSSLRPGYQEGAPVMIYRDAAELAEIERGLAAPLLLAGPDGRKPALIAAERQARYTAKKRAEAGAIG